jgi:hypothetical protein
MYMYLGLASPNTAKGERVMKKDQIRISGVYIAKISDKLTRVRIDGQNAHGGWDATNLSTNKKVRIKSPAKLRGPAPEKAAAAKADTPAAPAPATKPAKVTKAKKAPAEPKARKLSGLDAAAQVLKDAGQPMRCKDMVDTMLAKGLWKTNGRTPAATIYTAWTMLGNLAA